MPWLDNFMVVHIWFYFSCSQTLTEAQSRAHCGMVNLIVVVDADNSVPETDETNNAFAIAAKNLVTGGD